MKFVRKENEDGFWRLVETVEEIQPTNAIEECQDRFENAMDAPLADEDEEPSIENMVHAMNSAFLLGRALNDDLPSMSEIYVKHLNETGPILVNRAGGYHGVGDQTFVEVIEAENWEELDSLTNG